MMQTPFFMILPTDIQPSALGLGWGLSPDQTIEQLSMVPIQQDPSYIRVALPITGALHELEFFFENTNNRAEHYWYDGAGNLYDWAQGLMWDQTGNLVVGVPNTQRSGLFRIQTNLAL